MDRQELDELRSLLRQQTEMIESLRQQIANQQRQLEEQNRLLRQLLEERRQGREPAPATQQPVHSREGQSASAMEQAGESDPMTKQRLPQRPAAGAHEEAGTAGWNERHAFIRNSSGTFEAVFSGYGQFDYRGYEKNEQGLVNTFLIRRARFSVGGRIHQKYEYKVQADFADTAGTILRDGWINLNIRPEVQLKFGQFKEPFSQEELRDDENNDFVERSMVNNLVPSRSPGVELAGNIGGGIFSYQVGAFNGKGLLAPNTSSTPEGVVRLRLRPWMNRDGHRLQGLSFGGAAAVGRQRGGMSFIGRTESRSTTFFQPVPVNGHLLRANAELTYIYRGFALRSEFVQTHQERTGLGLNHTNLPGVIGKGLMVQGTYLLTGEYKPEDEAIAPRSGLWNKDQTERGIGAWEVKFRYSNLHFTNGFQSDRAETFSTGMNWYLTRSVKYMLDLNVERFADPRRAPRPGDRSFFSLLTRMQFTF
ncbi:MAG TPA: porin [Blastocatellia bacterium]|nr:porin [Blastocatellia bacterium]